MVAAEEAYLSCEKHFRLVTIAPTPPATIERLCQNTRMHVELAPFIYLWY